MRPLPPLHVPFRRARMMPACMLLAAMGSAHAVPSASSSGPPSAAPFSALDRKDKDDDKASYEADIAHVLDDIGKKAERVLKAKGIDWKKVSKKIKKQAAEIESDQELIQLARKIIAELHDGHAKFTKVEVDMEGSGDGPRQSGGISLYPYKGKWYVLRAVGAAKESGVKAGWEVVKMGGEKAKDWMEDAKERLTSKRGFSTTRAADWIVGTWGVNGPDGKSCSFEFKDEKRKAKKKTLTWGPKAGGGRLLGPVVYPENMKSVGKDVAYKKLESGMGYVVVAKVPGNLHEVFDDVIGGLGEIDGLILDFRSNMGGGYDRDALLGRFVPEGQSFGGEMSAGPHPYTGQIVVLVDPATISAGETVVGELKEEGRAYLIGPGGTHGASGSKDEAVAPSGKFSIRFVIASNKQRFNGGRGVEGLGIEPDEIVEYDPKLIVQGIDPCIQRAEELLKKPLPKKAVSYVPPKD